LFLQNSSKIKIPLPGGSDQQCRESGLEVKFSQVFAKIPHIKQDLGL
jgi:pyruvate/oxaloacetate carboxyltransferase